MKWYFIYNIEKVYSKFGFIVQNRFFLTKQTKQKHIFCEISLLRTWEITKTFNFS